MKRALWLSGILLLVAGCGSEEGADLYATVAPGVTRTCATTDAGQLLCWGDSIPFPNFLQTGPLRPTQVESGDFFTCGLLPGQGALCWSVGTPHVLPVAADLSFRDISVGQYTCGVTTQGKVFCWVGPTDPVGEKAGITGATEIGVGTGKACATGPGIGIWCWATPAAAPVLVPGTADSTYHGLTVGAGHACVLDAAGVARCWGTNTQGQTGVGHTGLVSSPTPVLWGDRPSNDDLFLQVSAGNGITCGATESHGGFCWGEGVAYPSSVAGEFAWDVIEAGGSHACGFTHGNSGLYCWGNNDQGQLGMGKFISTSFPQKVLDP